MNRKALAITASVAAVSASIVFGQALAAGQATLPPDTIHGCVDTSTSTRALVGVYTNNTNGLTCPANSMQIVFPKGPVTVTAGPAGLDITIALGSGVASTDVATCPADHPFVIGGGFTLEAGGPIIENHPQTSAAPQGWVASVSTGQVAAYAICAK